MHLLFWEGALGKVLKIFISKDKTLSQRSYKEEEKKLIYLILIILNYSVGLSHFTFRC